MMKAMMIAALALLAPLPALADATVTNPRARASIFASRPGAAYVTLQSTAGDRLIGVTTPVADQVMIHGVEEVNGVSRMEHLPTLDLPSGQPVMLTPGGTHLMLMGLKDKLEEGGRFPMTFQVEKAGAVTVDVPVLGIAAAGPGVTGQ